MKITVDTNLLVRVARVDDNAAQAQIAMRLLKDATLVAIPVIVLCEFDWVMRRSYKRPRAEVIAALRAIVGGPNVVLDRDAVAAGFAFLEAGGDFADGVVAFDGRRLGGTYFASFDRAARGIAAAAGFAVAPEALPAG